MGIKDLVFYPVFLIIAFIIFHLWQRFSQNHGSKWKLAYLFKILSALFIALLYQFYYEGGDTFNYFFHSQQLFNAILDHPIEGIKVLFSHNYFSPELSEHLRKMWYLDDKSSMAVVRVATFFSFFTLNTYLGISIFFATLSFSASYAIYRVFSDLYPKIQHRIFLVSFFIPSVAIWGSGLFKDTLTFTAMAWVVFGFYFMLIKKKKLLLNAFLIIISAYILLIVKIYILISLLPALMLWYIVDNLDKIKSLALRIIILPVFLAIAFSAGYFMIDRITQENERYALENISKTAQVTAMDIYAGWGAGAGSAYYLGEQDGSLSAFLSLIPSAIVVSLFRPWIWEINNFLMLIQSLESTLFLILFTIFVFKVKPWSIIKYSISNPDALFALVFSITMAIGVGIASYNFGTLSRYKIPLMPLFLIWMLIVYYEKFKKIET